MAEFTGRLVTEWLPDGEKCLVEPLRYDIGDKDSGVFIEAEIGMITDGTSIPWWLQWLIRKEGGEYPCSVIHDKGFHSGVFSVELIDPDNVERVLTTQIKVTEAMVNSAYREAMRVPRKDGTLAVHPVRRETLYWGLVAIGWLRWRQLRILYKDRDWTKGL